MRHVLNSLKKQKAHGCGFKATWSIYVYFIYDACKLLNVNLANRIVRNLFGEISFSVPNFTFQEFGFGLEKLRNFTKYCEFPSVKKEKRKNFGQDTP